MEVTYEKILGGYNLNTGDTLCLHGVEYEVKPHGDTYFLDNRGGFNGTIFQVLGINKVDFCEKIVGVKTYGGDFPEVNSLIHLTIVVKALYERSPYKVGDKVKLKDDVHGCPWVVSMMEKDAGKVVTIKDITLIPFSEHLNGDPHQYRFKEIVCTWSPQTIERKVEDAEVTKDTSADPLEQIVQSVVSRACPDDADMESSTDYHFVEESIIIQKPNPKIKTTIKL